MKVIFGMQMSKFAKWGFGPFGERVETFFFIFFSLGVYGPLNGDYGDNKKIITGDGRLHSNLSILRNQSVNFSEK